MTISPRLIGALPYRWGNIRRKAAMATGVLPYLTPRKIINALRCERDKWRRAPRPASWPYIAILDPANTCHLRCPYCPTGSRRPSGRGQQSLDPRLADLLVREAGAYLVSANLFNWGEPLLHPAIATLVAIFHQAGIFTSISSNLNLVADRGRLEEVCRAGLDHLMISVSGATQSTYSRYHRGGVLQRVLENTKWVTAFRRKEKLRRPFVEMKYLLFKHNRHEVEVARGLAYAAGADVFRVVTGGGPPEAVLPTREDPREGVAAGLCHHLWQAITIQADGGIAPCCYLFFQKDDFGHCRSGTVMQARLNERFVTARMLFDPLAVERLPPRLDHPCLKCHLVHDQAHLSAYLRQNPNAAKSHRTGGY